MTSQAGPAFYVWGISIAIHLLAIASLMLIRSGSPPAHAAKTPPVSRLAEVQELIRSEPILPKPQVAPPEPSPVETLPVLEESVPANADVEHSGRAIASAGHGGPQVEYIPPRVEFFGSTADERHVCFVVDASASMLGMFTQVRNTLIRSIGNLEADQYFGVIFFNDSITEFSARMLRRASPAAKAEAAEFIRQPRAAGPSVPLPALQRAMMAQDASGRNAGVIYFLTDGFDLGSRDTDKLVADIRSARARFAQQTKINTIGFWTSEADSLVLEEIARESGGVFVSIRN